MALYAFDTEKGRLIDPTELAELMLEPMLEKIKASMNDPYGDYPDYLKKQQVAEVLEMSRRTIDEWTKDPTIALDVAHKVGRSRRYCKKQVLGLMKSIKKKGRK